MNFRSRNRRISKELRLRGGRELGTKALKISLAVILVIAVGVGYVVWDYRALLHTKHAMLVLGTMIEDNYTKGVTADVLKKRVADAYRLQTGDDEPLATDG